MGHEIICFICLESYPQSYSHDECKGENCKGEESICPYCEYCSSECASDARLLETIKDFQDIIKDYKALIKKRNVKTATKQGKKIISTY